MHQGNLNFKPMLQAIGLTSGPVYATGLLKGHEAARMVADCKAQETIRAAHAIVISEAEPVGSVAHVVDRLATFYHSEHVKVCQPEILETPFEEWRDRQLAARGIVL
ncbi:hypothetical protein [Bacillus sp. FJAT-26390]|uniref:hypothetical protein n=1 Tax=Bacillus sp. FJAT-26390 TaxID=1743142 RepID=UPI0008081052|nr:hypothetical protein [Bacillus sp. FJAT-26390]OBZ08025.1 hypothetical protein A7975_27230 [Bacillus sp. FJAT-26390]